MDWLSFSGKIGRRDFAVRVGLIMLVCGGGFFVFRDAIYALIGLTPYFVAKSLVNLAIVLLCLPSLMRRLRDIELPVQGALLFLFLGVINISNITVAGYLLGRDIFVPAPLGILFLAVYLSAGILFLILLFRRGKVHESQFEP